MKKKNTMAALLLIVVAAVGGDIFSAGTIAIIQSAQAFIDPTTNARTEPKAPTVITGENVYVVWWTDKGTPNTNGEVMFRASNDGGETFGNKTNLSNTPTADSVDAEISAEGTTVMVTWWERNQTTNVPVAKISTDGGETFGAMMMLGMNGTISDTEEGGAAEGGETTEEEAVGGAEVAE